MPDKNLDQLIEKAADMIVASKRLMVFTGAGISTESGLPDFRSPGGIWSKYDPDEFTFQRFISDHEIRKKQWCFFYEGGLVGSVEPNAAHFALAELQKMGKLDSVITQNIDGLHQMAGVSPQNIFQLHGSMTRARCLDCGEVVPMDEINRRIAGGEEVPYCGKCGGILKPDVVLFGEALPEAVLLEASERSRRCDLCLVIGSSLLVYPAAMMPRYAVRSGAKLVILNRDPTDMDGSAEVCMHVSAGETMTRIVQIVKRKLFAGE